MDDNAQVQNWSARLRGELRRDKKRAAILVSLMVVAGIVGGRLVVSSGLPRNARGAGAPAASESPPAPQAPPARAEARRNVPRISDAEREAFLANMDRTITRDLFKPVAENFPPEGGAAPAGLAATAETSQEPGMFHQVQQWLSRQESVELLRQERAGFVRAQAQALSLQSTMLGSSPTALINGQVLRKGDWISGFCLKSIASGSCVVSKDGVDVELTMKQ